jgi:integrase
MPKYKYSREHYLNREEVIAMINGASEDWFKALLSCLYLYGLRISEALDLKPADFKTEYKKHLAVTVRLSKKRKMHSSPVVPQHIVRVSYKKPSLQPFIFPLVQYIVARSKTHPADKLWSCDRVTVWHKIKALNQKCSSHLFRHSRLHQLAEQGASGLVLKDFAGWADLRPASNYVATTGDLAKKYSDKIE